MIHPDGQKRMTVPVQPPEPQPSPPAEAPPEPALRARLRSRRLLIALAGVVVLLLIFGAVLRGTVLQQPASPTPSAAPSPPKLEARGEVRPIAQARIASLIGGTVTSVSVDVGQSVEAKQEIARVTGADRTELIVAPWAGTVSGLMVHAGDTVTPGTVLATVADLSRLQVETTDVDEFLIGHVRKGQTVKLSVDALDGREIKGQVRTLAPEPQLTSTGDKQYPVVIDLPGGIPELRAGMSVRISFSD